jgi:hypothetical protein
MGLEQLPQLCIGRTRQGEDQRLAARRNKEGPSGVGDAQPEVPLAHPCKKRKDGPPWVRGGSHKIHFSRKGCATRPVGSSEGSWYNAGTNESFHPDLSHPDPIGPHYDYRDALGNDYRVFPDGTVVPK